MSTFPHLFSPLDMGPVRLPNRIVSTGHDTCMTDGGLVSDRMVAYHKARATGGVGLIVLQVASVHETAQYTAGVLRAHDDACIPGLAKLADAVQAKGTKVFGQLLHPGREIHGSDDGTRQVCWSASAVPNERFHAMPRALEKPMIDEIVAGFAAAAGRMAQAGLDGVEVVACYQYLAAQFLSEATNQRTDEYGGSFDNRMRFLREVLVAIRAAVGPDKAVGLRLSADDMDNIGLNAEEALACATSLDADGLVDFISLALGSSASRGGAYHVAAPMHEPEGYSAPYATRFTKALGVPVIITGRIVQPQTAEKIIASGQADACGMTRALICDADLPAKAREARTEDIRACIGCNQACIGHFFLGAPISCIQNPLSGREVFHAPAVRADVAKSVMVVGGGPAGMKAAVEAAMRGHKVQLLEATGQLGGQARLAQLLPGRAEFGGLITNLQHELSRAKVQITLNAHVTPYTVGKAAPDAVIIATGATPRPAPLEGEPEIQVVTAEAVLEGGLRVGKDVVIADWRCDWIGIGLAERFAAEGSRVRLVVNGAQPGDEIMSYMRDHAAGRLFSAGVEVIPYARLFGAEGAEVYFEHVTALQPIILEGVDTLVTVAGSLPCRDLAEALAAQGRHVIDIGDCRAPRTAEEAVLEGFNAAQVL